MNTVYAVYSKRNRLIYIGQTKDIDAREYQHITDEDGPIYAWTSKNGLVRFKVVGYYDEDTAKSVEAALIAVMRPLLNKNTKSESSRSRYMLKPRKRHSKTLDRSFQSDLSQAPPTL